MLEEKKLIDCFSVSLPSSCNDLKEEFIRLQDSGSKRALEVEVDVTHGGYVNKNFYFYKPSGQAKSIETFFKPYPTPVLYEHDGGASPCGRTYASAYVPLNLTPENMDDNKVPKSKVRVKSIITDERAIEKILDRRYLTVSTGSVPKTSPICSICQKPVWGDSGNSDDRCEHYRGSVYDGKQCYWIIDEVGYNEYSFVNFPADSTETHAATVVNFKLVDLTLSSNRAPSVDFDNLFEENKLMDKVIDNAPSGIIPEASDATSPLMDDLFNAFILASIADADCVNCDDGDVDIEDKWNDDKEVKELESLSDEFEVVVGMVLGDAPLTPAQRKKLKSATFCGPNKTFPIPDCKRAATALAMLSWPKVKAKYSESVRAKIAACVRAKAKKLNCPMAKEDSHPNQEINNLEATIAQMRIVIEKSNEKIVDLLGEIKKISTEPNRPIKDLSSVSEPGLTDAKVLPAPASVVPSAKNKDEERRRKVTKLVFGE